MPLPALLLTALALLAPGAPPRAERPAANAPRAQLVLTLNLTRADSEKGKTSAAPQVVGTPRLSTLDGNTGYVQVSGDDLSYAVSLSPTIEAGGSIALLWNLQLSGRSLPGANSATVSGATRVAPGRQEPVAELTLRDPKTGRQSAFRLEVTTTVTDAGKAAPPATPPPASPSGTGR